MQQSRFSNSPCASTRPGPVGRSHQRPGGTSGAFWKPLSYQQETTCWRVLEWPLKWPGCWRAKDRPKEQVDKVWLAKIRPSHCLRQKSWHRRRATWWMNCWPLWDCQSVTTTNNLRHLSFCSLRKTSWLWVKTCQLSFRCILGDGYLPIELSFWEVFWVTRMPGLLISRLLRGVLSTSCNPYVQVDFNGTSQRTQTQRPGAGTWSFL